MLHCGTMKKNTFYILLACILAFVILAVGLAMTTGNPLVPALVIIGGIATTWLAKRQVTEVMSDDLSETIYGRAALKALVFTIIIAAILYAGAMTYYFNSGYGGGFHTNRDGSVNVSFAFDSPVPGQQDVWDHYTIANPADMTGDDFWGLDRVFGGGHKAREFPYAFGMGMGFAVLLLTGLYAAFSYYYTRKYEE